MIYNVAGLLMDSEGSTRSYEIDGEELLTDRHRFRGIKGTVNMLRTDRTILVSVRVSASTADSCSRCLEPARLEVIADLAEEFQPVNFDLMGERAAPVEPDFDEALVIDERNILDLSRALGEALSGCVPIAPLCKPDCKGICFTCFADRNRNTCTCDENPTDIRWKKLAELIPDSSNSEH